MFENLSERLGRTLKSLRGQGRLSEDNIKDTVREVRMALLEADVALPVVKAFVERVREWPVAMPGSGFSKHQRASTSRLNRGAMRRLFTPSWATTRPRPTGSAGPCA